MKKLKYIGKLVAVALIGVLGVSGCSKQEVIVNEVPKEEQKIEQENRIIALSISLVDILGELGIEMVGVPKTQYNLHENAKGVEEVGLPMSPDLERIAMLKPTHILGVTALKSTIEPKLQQIGVEGTFLNLDNIDTLEQSIEEIGKLFEKEEEATKLIEDFRGEINATIDSVAGKESPKVLILFGFPGNYLAATGTSFVGQMVEMLGGINVVPDASMAFANVNLEALLTSEPDIILRMTHGMKEEVLEMFAKEFNENPLWKQFKAVQEDAVYDLDDSLFNVSASLETADALKVLAKILYE